MPWASFPGGVPHQWPSRSLHSCWTLIEPTKIVHLTASSQNSEARRASYPLRLESVSLSFCPWRPQIIFPVILKVCFGIQQALAIMHPKSHDSLSVIAGQGLALRSLAQFPHLVVHSVALSRHGWTPAMPEPGFLSPQVRPPCISLLNGAANTMWSCWWPREPTCMPRPEGVSFSPRMRVATSTLVSSGD